MAGKTEAKDAVIVPGAIIMPYKYSVGSVGAKFFIELRDKKRILGIRCPQCNRVYVPPRSVCGTCFNKLDEWAEVASKGTLLTYTVVHYSLPVHPVQPPFAYGIIQLDGADTGLTHFLGEVDLQDIAIGMRLEAVFKAERKGNILDIDYFRPLRA